MERWVTEAGPLPSQAMAPQPPSKGSPGFPTWSQPGGGGGQQGPSGDRDGVMATITADRLGSVDHLNPFWPVLFPRRR